MVSAAGDVHRYADYEAVMGTTLEILKDYLLVFIRHLQKLDFWQDFSRVSA
jgi:hypothetical protein